MKKISALWFSLGLLLQQCGLPQPAVAQDKVDFIPSYHLEISYDKTSNIIFPYAIKSADRGSRDILVQKVAGSDNVLQLKAAKKGFSETNLSVITDDNKLYSFIVDYNNDPQKLNWRFPAVKPEKLQHKTLNAASFKAAAGKIMAADKTIHLNRRQYQMLLSLEGIYAVGNTIVLKIKLQNESNIGYDVESIRFVIKDKQQAKRTASQEKALQALYVYHTPAAIGADSTAIIIYALPKFSLSNKQYMEIALAEKHGSRNLQLRLKSHALLKAEKL